jgi:hypothetical protein
MRKAKATSADIRQEIQRRIETSLELGDDGKNCRAPTPRSIDPMDQKDTGGCNWTVDIFPGIAPGCLDCVKFITLSVMNEYDLNEEAL